MTHMSHCKNSNDIFLFFDPMHQMHNNENEYCWQEKGANGTKTVLSNSGRKRLNIIGALNPLTLETTTIISEDNCDRFMIMKFLDQVRLKYPKEKHKTITIVLDNAPYNRSYETREYAEKLDIKLLYLPPYSPNLNLIERLWKFFKKKLIKNHYYKEFKDLWNTTIDFFQNFEIYLDELKSLLTLNFEIIRNI